MTGCSADGTAEEHAFYDPIIARLETLIKENVVSQATYRVTNETRAALALFVEDLSDIAAQGNTPMADEVVTMIERVLEDGVYTPLARDAEGQIVDEENELDESGEAT